MGREQGKMTRGPTHILWYMIVNLPVIFMASHCHFGATVSERFHLPQLPLPYLPSTATARQPTHLIRSLREDPRDPSP